MNKKILLESQNAILTIESRSEFPKFMEFIERYFLLKENQYHYKVRDLLDSYDLTPNRLNKEIEDCGGLTLRKKKRCDICMGRIEFSISGRKKSLRQY